jgi:phage gp46-like protein
MPQSWDLDPKTGDYMIDDRGHPVETDSLRVPAYIRLKAPKQGAVRRDGSPGGWMYAPNPQWGSGYWTKAGSRSGIITPTQLENVAATALQPLLDSGRASAITVDLVATSRGTTSLKTAILETNGQESQLLLPSLGV